MITKNGKKKIMEMCHKEYRNLSSVVNCINKGLKELKGDDPQKTKKLIRLNNDAIKRLSEFVDRVGIVLNSVGR